MKKIQVYWMGFSLVMRHRGTILILKAGERAWSGNILVCHKSSSSEVSPLPKNVANLLLRYERGYLEHYQEKGQTVNSATYSSMIEDKLRPQFAAKEEDCCQKLLFSTLTTLAPISWLHQRRQLETSSLRFCHMHLTVLISHHATFLSSVHLKGHYVGAGLAVIKK
jgi:hypothetical protein